MDDDGACRDIIIAILTSLGDADRGVKGTAGAVLRTSAAMYGTAMLANGTAFLVQSQQHKKLSLEHRASILSLMCDVACEMPMSDLGAFLRESIGAATIELCMLLLVQDETPPITQGATALLVALAVHGSMDVVLNTLLENVTSKEVPQDCILSCLKAVAERDAMSSFARSYRKHQQGSDLGMEMDEDMRSLLSSTYELFLDTWAQNPKAKCQLPVLEALGQLSLLVPPTSLEAGASKMVPLLLQLYKREAPSMHLHISLGLSGLLEAAVIAAASRGIQVVDMQSRAQLLGVILPLVAVIPVERAPSPGQMDVETALLSKNHNELLRCFELLTEVRATEVIAFLVEKLDAASSDSTRLGVYTVLKHLIPRFSLENAQESIAEAMQAQCLVETELALRKAIVQVIACIGTHGYLARAPEGRILVDFLLWQSAITEEEMAKWRAGVHSIIPLGFSKVKHSLESTVSPEELHLISDNVLQMMAATVPEAEPLLWPYLFKAFMAADGAGCMSTVAKCLAEIAANKKRRSAGLSLDCEESKSLPCEVPKPQELLARVTVNLHLPHRRQDLGQALITMLLAMPAIFHDELETLWQGQLPLLAEILADGLSRDALKQAAWDARILDFLSATLEIAVSNTAQPEDWLRQLADALLRQYPLYAREPFLLSVIHRQLGVVLRMMEHDWEYVKAALGVMYHHTNVASEMERKGLAQGWGEVARTHLDIVLEKMQNLLDTESARKPSGFMGFVQEKLQGPDVEHLRALVALTYGFAAACAPASIIASRLDNHIVNNLLTKLMTLKSAHGRESVILAIDMLGKCVAAASSSGTLCQLDRRDALLKQLLGYIKEPPLASGSALLSAVSLLKGAEGVNLEHLHLQALAVDACGTLCGLSPDVPTLLAHELVTMAVQLFDAPDEPSELTGRILSNTNRLMGVLLWRSSEDKDGCDSMLSDQLAKMDPWLAARGSTQRERASACVLYLLQRLDQLSSRKSMAGLLYSRSCLHLGQRLAHYVPLLNDPTPSVRASAAQIVERLVSVAAILQLHEQEALSPVTSAGGGEGEGEGAVEGEGEGKGKGKGEGAGADEGEGHDEGEGKGKGKGKGAGEGEDKGEGEGKGQGQHEQTAAAGEARPTSPALNEEDMRRLEELATIARQIELGCTDKGTVAATRDMMQLIGPLLSCHEASSFTQAACEGLLVGIPETSLGTAVAITIICTQKGKEMLQAFPSVMQPLLKTMRGIQDKDVYQLLVDTVVGLVAVSEGSGVFCGLLNDCGTTLDHRGAMTVLEALLCDERQGLRLLDFFVDELWKMLPPSATNMEEPLQAQAHAEIRVLKALLAPGTTTASVGGAATAISLTPAMVASGSAPAGSTVPKYLDTLRSLLRHRYARLLCGLMLHLGTNASSSDRADTREDHADAGKGKGAGAARGHLGQSGVGTAPAGSGPSAGVPPRHAGTRTHAAMQDLLDTFRAFSELCGDAGGAALADMWQRSGGSGARGSSGAEGGVAMVPPADHSEVGSFIIVSTAAMGYEEGSHQEEVACVVSATCRMLVNKKDAGAIVPEVCRLLQPFVAHPHRGLRQVAVAAFAELMGSSTLWGEERPGDMLPFLVTSIKDLISDDCRAVRRQCVRGLSQIPGPRCEEFAAIVVGVLLTGMGDAANSVALQAIQGLIVVLGFLSDASISAMVAVLCSQLHALQSHVMDDMRASAFLALAKLGAVMASREGGGRDCGELIQEVHASMVPLLLHAGDGSSTVRTSCKTTLRTVAPLLGSEELVVAVRSPQLEREDRESHEDILRRATGVLVDEFPDSLGVYLYECLKALGSHWEELQATALLCGGWILCHLITTERFYASSHKHAEVRQMFDQTLKLSTKSPTAAVRNQAVAVLGHILACIRGPESSPSKLQ
eukprot:jgi/Mesvir1/27103/Mv20785-RA.1